MIGGATITADEAGKRRIRAGDWRRSRLFLQYYGLDDDVSDDVYQRNRRHV